MAFYATQIGNKGHYLDLVTKVGYLSSNYQTTYGDSADFDNWAFSAGAGHRPQEKPWETMVRRTSGPAHLLLPQRRQLYDENGATVNQDNTDNLVGRLGAVLTKEYDKETKNPKRFYVKASVQHDFLEAEASISSKTVDGPTMTATTLEIRGTPWGSVRTSIRTTNMPSTSTQKRTLVPTSNQNTA